MTPKEIIAVVEAFERGETIQYRSIAELSIGNDDWISCQQPTWNFMSFQYRSKIIWETKLVPHWPAVIRDKWGHSYLTAELFPTHRVSQAALRLATELPPIMLPGE